MPKQNIDVYVFSEPQNIVQDVKFYSYLRSR